MVVVHLRDIVECERAVAALVEGDAFGEEDVLRRRELDLDFVCVAEGAGALEIV